jgi:hypothetical protein
VYENGWWWWSFDVVVAVDNHADGDDDIFVWGGTHDVFERGWCSRMNM